MPTVAEERSNNSTQADHYGPSDSVSAILRRTLKDRLFRENLETCPEETLRGVTLSDEERSALISRDMFRVRSITDSRKSDSTTIKLHFNVAVAVTVTVTDADSQRQIDDFAKLFSQDELDALR
jgi:hypothetical protein